MTLLRDFDIIYFQGCQWQHGSVELQKFYGYQKKDLLQLQFVMQLARSQQTVATNGRGTNGSNTP